MQANWQHMYLPGTSFTQKIEQVLHEVTTTYAAMCADDDFIVTESLCDCVHFLDEHSDYAIAQGKAIRYDKESIATGNIRYRLLYNETHNVEEEDAKLRLQHMFHPYRSVLYAVFRTSALRNAFYGAGEVVSQLYLNEYITAFIPILSGKYIELPLLYQVREFALDSDDKTAVNLDNMVNESRYSHDLSRFTAFIIHHTSALTGMSLEETETFIQAIITAFAKQLSDNRIEKISVKKRIGALIQNVPFIGKQLIEKNRAQETAAQLQTVVSTAKDRKELQRISDLLIQYHLKNN